jgi:hypothetical protein
MNARQKGQKLMGATIASKKAVKPTLVDAVNADPAPVNAAISGLVADIATSGKKSRVSAGTAAKRAGKPAAVKRAATAFSGPTPVPAGEKFCKRHNTTHPLGAFASDKSSPTGRYSICRVAEAEDRAAKKAGATLAPIAQPVNTVSEMLKATSPKAGKSKKSAARR